MTSNKSWQHEADVLAHEAIAANDPTGWFERLYAAGEAGEVSMPWDRDGPRQPLADWIGDRGIRGNGRRALVIACGLGADSEYLAELGFHTDAFDISETAIRTVHERYPDSAVRYRVADMFDPPAEWTHAFELVVEIFTVQALPRRMRQESIQAVRNFVAPGGTLLVIAAKQADGADLDEGPPWPLTRSDMESFAGNGLSMVSLEELPDGIEWQAELTAEAWPG